MSTRGVAAPSAVEVVVLDFDGLLVDSVGIKTDAFAAMYSPHGPGVIEQVCIYHLANGGLSRYAKLEHFERELLGRDPTPEQIDELADEFARRVVDSVVAADEMDGASELLDALHGRVALYVASGTPQSELVEIVRRRGWSAYFDGVHGTPADKAEILGSIAERTRRPPERLLMAGDATTDLEGARTAGTQFVGYAVTSSSPFDDDVEVVSSLHDLREIIEARLGAG